MNKKSNNINKKRKIKNKTLRKNRKSKKNKKIYKKGGTTIYDMDTDAVEHPDITYNGFPYFRKLYSKNPNEEQKYLKKVENAIVKILMEHPNPNIVKYYDTNDRYVDMEEVNTFKSNPSFFDEPVMTSKEILEIQEVMGNVKDFLQGLGIMYIDWKFDNIGKSIIDGKYKLFDFDASGLIDLLTKKWKLKPNEKYWSYKQAIKNGSKTPKEIDDWSFHHNIIEEGNKMIESEKT
jgi:serine/threonine protein kinase